MTDDARKILSENILGTLATVNEDGSPWASPLHIFFDEKAVYWFSGSTSQHSENVARNPKVSVAVFSPDMSKGLSGVYVNGTAEVLDEAATQAAKQLVLERIGSIPPVYEHATGYRLPFGTLNTSRSYGNCWYFYT